MAGLYNFTATMQIKLANGTLQGLRQQVQAGVKGLTIPVQLAVGANSQVGNLAGQVKALQGNLAGVANAGAGLTTVAGNMTRAASAASAANTSFAQTSSTVRNAAGSMRSFSGEFEHFGHQARLAGQRWIAFTVAVGTVSTVFRVFKEALNEGLAFEKQMTKIAQISTESSAEIAVIPETVTRVAKAWGVSSTSLINVAEQLKQTGLSIKDVNQAIEAIGKASLAPTFGDLSKTTQGAIAAMRQFKIETSDLEGVLGSINEVAANFAVESGDIIEAVKRAGGVFASAGGNLNEFQALFTAVRATTRQSAEVISTGLRTIFTRIQRPETIEHLKQLGVQLQYNAREAQQLGKTSLEGQFVGPLEAVQRIGAAIKNLQSTDPRFAAIAEEIGGYRQIAQVIPLLQEQKTITEALSVAQAGQVSLTTAAEKAQGQLAIQTQKVKEEFLELGRGLINNTGFRSMVGGLLSLASAMATIIDYAKPLLPLLVSLAAIKVGQGLGAMFRGFSTPTFRKADGGLVDLPRYHKGGKVKGQGEQLAILEGGEYVLPKNVAQRYESGGVVATRPGVIGIVALNKTSAFPATGFTENIPEGLVKPFNALIDNTSQPIKDPKVLGQARLVGLTRQLIGQKARPSERARVLEANSQRFGLGDDPSLKNETNVPLFQSDLPTTYTRMQITDIQVSALAKKKVAGSRARIGAKLHEEIDNNLTNLIAHALPKIRAEGADKTSPGARFHAIGEELVKTVHTIVKRVFPNEDIRLSSKDILTRLQGGSQLHNLFKSDLSGEEKKKKRFYSLQDRLNQGNPDGYRILESLNNLPFLRGVLFETVLAATRKNYTSVKGSRNTEALDFDEFDVNQFPPEVRDGFGAGGALVRFADAKLSANARAVKGRDGLVKKLINHSISFPNDIFRLFQIGSLSARQAERIGRRSKQLLGVEKLGRPEDVVTPHVFPRDVDSLSGLNPARSYLLPQVRQHLYGGEELVGSNNKYITNKRLVGSLIERIARTPAAQREALREELLNDQALLSRFTPAKLRAIFHVGSNKPSLGAAPETLNRRPKKGLFDHVLGSVARLPQTEGGYPNLGNPLDTFLEAQASVPASGSELSTDHFPAVNKLITASRNVLQATRANQVIGAGGPKVAQKLNRLLMNRYQRLVRMNENTSPRIMSEEAFSDLFRRINGLTERVRNTVQGPSALTYADAHYRLYQDLSKDLTRHLEDARLSLAKTGPDVPPGIRFRRSLQELQGKPNPTLFDQTSLIELQKLQQEMGFAQGGAVPPPLPDWFVKQNQKKVVTTKKVKEIIQEFSDRTGINFNKLADSVKFGDLESQDIPGSKSLGRFSLKGGKRTIYINPNDIKSEEQLRFVLAHEFGHAADYFVPKKQRLSSNDSDSTFFRFGSLYAKNLQDSDARSGRKARAPQYRYSVQEGFANLFAEQLTGISETGTDKKLARDFEKNVFDPLAKLTAPPVAEPIIKKTPALANLPVKKTSLLSKLNPFRLFGFAQGGAVNSLVMPGEYIFGPEQTKKIGLNRLHSLNDHGKFDVGGLVPGTGSTDSVPMYLPTGSFVIKKKSVQQVGLDNLRSLEHFATGGKKPKVRLTEEQRDQLLQLQLDQEGKKSITVEERLRQQMQRSSAGKTLSQEEQEQVFQNVKTELLSFNVKHKSEAPLPQRLFKNAKEHLSYYINEAAFNKGTHPSLNLTPEQKEAGLRIGDRVTPEQLNEFFKHGFTKAQRIVSSSTHGRVAQSKDLDVSGLTSDAFFDAGRLFDASAPTAKNTHINKATGKPYTNQDVFSQDPEVRKAVVGRFVAHVANNAKQHIQKATQAQAAEGVPVRERTVKDNFDVKAENAMARQFKESRHATEGLSLADIEDVSQTEISDQDKRAKVDAPRTAEDLGRGLAGQKTNKPASSKALEFMRKARAKTAAKDGDPEKLGLARIQTGIVPYGQQQRTTRRVQKYLNAYKQNQGLPIATPENLAQLTVPPAPPVIEEPARTDPQKTAPQANVPPVPPVQPPVVAVPSPEEPAKVDPQKAVQATVPPVPPAKPPVVAAPSPEEPDKGKAEQQKVVSPTSAHKQTHAEAAQTLQENIKRLEQEQVQDEEKQKQAVQKNQEIDKQSKAAAKKARAFKGTVPIYILPSHMEELPLVDSNKAGKREDGKWQPISAPRRRDRSQLRPDVQARIQADLSSGEELQKEATHNLATSVLGKGAQERKNFFSGLHGTLYGDANDKGLSDPSPVHNILYANRAVEESKAVLKHANLAPIPGVSLLNSPLSVDPGPEPTNILGNLPEPTPVQRDPYKKIDRKILDARIAHDVNKRALNDLLTQGSDRAPDHADRQRQAEHAFFASQKKLADLEKQKQVRVQEDEAKQTTTERNQLIEERRAKIARPATPQRAIEIKEEEKARRAREKGAEFLGSLKEQEAKRVQRAANRPGDVLGSEAYRAQRDDKLKALKAQKAAESERINKALAEEHFIQEDKFDRLSLAKTAQKAANQKQANRDDLGGAAGKVNPLTGANRYQLTSLDTLTNRRTEEEVQKRGGYGKVSKETVDTIRTEQEAKLKEQYISGTAAQLKTLRPGLGDEEAQKIAQQQYAHDYSNERKIAEAHKAAAAAAPQGSPKYEKELQKQLALRQAGPQNNVVVDTLSKQFLGNQDNVDSLLKQRKRADGRQEASDYLRSTLGLSSDAKVDLALQSAKGIRNNNQASADRDQARQYSQMGLQLKSVGGVDDKGRLTGGLLQDRYEKEVQRQGGHASLSKSAKQQILSEQKLKLDQEIIAVTARQLLAQKKAATAEEARAIATERHQAGQETKERVFYDKNTKKVLGYGENIEGLVGKGRLDGISAETEKYIRQTQGIPAGASVDHALETDKTVRNYQQDLRESARATRYTDMGLGFKKAFNLDEKGQLIGTGGGLLEARYEDEIKRRGGHAVLSNATKKEILEQQRIKLEQEIITVTARQLLAQKKATSVTEARRLAEEQHQQALKDGTAVLYDRKTKKAVGYEENVAGLMGKGRLDGYSWAGGAFADFRSKVGEISSNAYLGTKNFSDWIGRKTGFGQQGTLGQIASIGASVAGSYVSDALGRQAGTAENAVLGGTEGSYGAYKTTAGALQGAILGGSLGAAVGGPLAPLTAAIGVAAGGAIGFYTSLKEASKEIRAAKLANALNLFSEKLNQIATDKALNINGAGALSAAGTLAEIKTIKKEAGDTALAEATTLGYTNFEKYGLLRQKEERQAFAPQLPAINNALGSFIEDLTKKNPSASIDDLMDTFKKGNNGLNAELLNIIANLRKIPLASVVEEKRKELIKAQNAAKLELSAKTGQAGDERQLNMFGRLLIAADSASNGLASLEQRARNLGEIFEGQAGAVNVLDLSGRFRNFGTQSSSQLIEASSPIAAAGGKIGEQFQASAIAANKVASILPAILTRVLSGKPYDESSFVNQTRGLLTQRLGFKDNDQIPDEYLTAINSVVGNLGKQLLPDIAQSVSTDSTKFTEKLLSSLLDPLKEVGENFGKRMATEANRFIEGLTQSYRQLRAIGEGQYRGDQLNLGRLKQEAAFQAEARGTPSRAADFLTLAQLQQPFQARQERLSGFAGEAAANPEFLGKRLAETREQINLAVHKQNEAFVQGGGKSDAFTQAAENLARLKDQSSRLQEALKHLTDASERNAGAQEKLAKIQQDKEGRTSFFDRYINSGAEERVNTQRGLLLTHQAANVGSVRGFGPDDQRLILSTLQSLGGAKLTGLKGQETADYYRNLFIREFSGGLLQDPANKDEEKDLKKVIVENFVTAQAAQKELVESQKSVNQDFVVNLQQTHQQFFAQLNQDLKNFLVVQTQVQRDQVSGQLFKQGPLQKARETLATVGIKDDAQLEVLQKHAPAIGKLALYDKNTQTSTNEQKEKYDRLILEARDAKDALVTPEKIAALAKKVGAIPDDAQKEKEFSSAFFTRYFDLRSRKASGVFLTPPKEGSDLDLKIRSEAILSALEAVNKQGDEKKSKERESLVQDIKRGGGEPILDIVSKGNTEEILKAAETLKGKSLTDLGKEFDRLTTTAAGLDEALKKLQVDQGNANPGNDGRRFGFATGGKVSGLGFPGSPQGTDTVPAWLTPNEYVVNADATRANYGLLEQINKSKGPVRLSRGGIVYAADGGAVPAPNNDVDQAKKKYSTYLEGFFSRNNLITKEQKIQGLEKSLVLKFNKDMDLYSLQTAVSNQDVWNSLDNDTKGYLSAVYALATELQKEQKVADQVNAKKYRDELFAAPSSTNKNRGTDPKVRQNEQDKWAALYQKTMSKEQIEDSIRAVGDANQARKDEGVLPFLAPEQRDKIKGLRQVQADYLLEKAGRAADIAKTLTKNKFSLQSDQFLSPAEKSVVRGKLANFWTAHYALGSFEDRAARFAAKPEWITPTAARDFAIIKDRLPEDQQTQFNAFLEQYQIFQQERAKREADRLNAAKARPQAGIAPNAGAAQAADREKQIEDILRREAIRNPYGASGRLLLGRQIQEAQKVRREKYFASLQKEKENRFGARALFKDLRENDRVAREDERFFNLEGNKRQAQKHEEKELSSLLTRHYYRGQAAFFRRQQAPVPFPNVLRPGAEFQQGIFGAGFERLGDQARKIINPDPFMAERFNQGRRAAVGLQQLPFDRLRPLKRAGGGIIPGNSTLDDTLVMAQGGEYVLNRNATQALGVARLDKINRFGSGGLVQDQPPLYPESHSLVQSQKWPDPTLWIEDPRLKRSLYSPTETPVAKTPGIPEGWAKLTLALTDFTSSSQLLIRSLSQYTETNNALVQALSTFGTNGLTLTQALLAFPRKLEVQSTGRHEIILNGAEVLSNIMPELQEMIMEQIGREISKTFKERLPDS